MLDFITDNLLLTGGGAAAIIFVLTKVLPNKKIAIVFYKLFMGLSSLGRGKFGIKFWRVLRHWGEDTAQVIVNNSINGSAHFENKEKIEKAGGKVVGLKWDKESKQTVMFIEGDKVNEKDIYKDVNI